VTAPSPTLVARRRDPRHTALLVVVAVAVGLVVTATGSYGLGWQWTGFRGNKVWDWMHLLLVPIVLGAQPLWIRTRNMNVPWRAVVISVLIVVGGFIAMSYGFHWAWTGFEGKQLWDWLNLVVLPTVLGLAGLWLGGERPRYWRPVALALLGVFVVLIVGGYQLGWSWTGFEGNKLWDWLNLLVLPFAVPAAFIWIGFRLEDERRVVADEREDELRDAREVADLSGPAATAGTVSAGRDGVNGAPAVP
jgi:peptidoglycan/LPS O-acetylase OafA/YrhL